MNKNDVLNIILRFKESVESKGIRVDRIILYGSWAENKRVDNSDIDIVVISDDFSDKGYWDRMDIISTAVHEIYQPVEAVAITLEEWEKGNTFIANYARNGEVVYSQKDKVDVKYSSVR